jgi:histidine triad (HIT) family protein
MLCSIIPLVDRECSFCRIVEGTQPARVVYETSRILAFFPLAPAVLGHTLVIPKKHIEDLWSLDDDWGDTLLESCLDIAKGLKRALNPDGMNLINSAGEAASQSITHIHFHLVPRWRDDTFGPIWPHSAPISDELKNDTADRIRKAIINRG